LIFTRQKLPVIDRTKYASAGGLHRGAYVIWQSDNQESEVILVGTGSEVHVALRAGEKLAAEGYHVRVVSMPSWELFDKQPEDYRKTVLPPNVRARVSIEAGVKIGWEHYVGADGVILGLDHFGASAPGEILFEKFGLTPESVVAAAKKLLQMNQND